MKNKITNFIINLLIGFFYFIYKAEALNKLFLIIPASLVKPQLCKHGASIGDEVTISTPIIIHNHSTMPFHHYENIHIGNASYLGKEVFLDIADKIIIEENVTISMRVTILTHVNVGKSPLKTTRLPDFHAPVVIRRGSYIGAGAIILPGVEIGPEVIVAAGAVVNYDIDPGDTVGGVPAKSIKMRSRNFHLDN